MIVAEGMPGAGKTSLLGRFLGERAVVFPEAQPDPAAAEGAAAGGLLAEDAARLDQAPRLESEGRTVLSDRCYAGVLAYRHALAATGRTGPAPLDETRRTVEDLALRERHATSTIIVVRIDVATSLERRATVSPEVRARFAEWFDPRFLEAYAAFWEDPAAWAPPSAAVHVVADSGAAAKAVADAAGITPRPFGDPPEEVLSCPRACGAPRSPVVGTGGARVQLAARGLHHAHGTGRTVCLRRAETVAACWL